MRHWRKNGISVQIQKKFKNSKANPLNGPNSKANPLNGPNSASRHRYQQVSTHMPLKISCNPPRHL